MNWQLFTFVLAVAVCALAVYVWRLRREAVRARRERFIHTYVFPSAIFKKLHDKHAQLSLKDTQLVTRALREYFLAYLRSKFSYVGMPSLVVDDLWHEFILHTFDYTRFCQQAFGRYFHHTPAGAMGKSGVQDSGLRLTWRHVCLHENINPRKPTRLPLLFAIDEKLKIAGGYHYSLERKGKKGADGDSGSCGGGCGGGSGSSGFACKGGGLAGEGSDSATGDSGGCGGGCGGD